MEKYLTKDLAKKLAKFVYVEVAYPAAQEYVKSTDKAWDDQALAYVDSFIQDFLGIKDK